MPSPPQVTSPKAWTIELLRARQLNPILFVSFLPLAVKTYLMLVAQNGCSRLVVSAVVLLTRIVSLLCINVATNTNTYLFICTLSCSLTSAHGAKPFLPAKLLSLTMCAVRLCTGGVFLTNRFSTPPSLRSTPLCAPNARLSAIVSLCTMNTFVMFTS